MIREYYQRSIWSRQFDSANELISFDLVVGKKDHSPSMDLCKSWDKAHNLKASQTKQQRIAVLHTRDASSKWLNALLSLRCNFSPDSL